ncbi:MAG: AMP-binding protein [Candidatus Dormibacteria bacterium]
MRNTRPKFDALTPLSFLERAGEVYGHLTAVVDRERRYTYTEFTGRARRMASALRLAGLKRNDKVAFLALNSDALLMAHFAVPLAGGVLVAMNTRLTAAETAYVVTNSQARWLFYSPSLVNLTALIGPRVRTVALDGSLEILLASGCDDPVEWSVSHEADPIAIDYTSGTTGRPKGVVYHHRGAYLNALGMIVENHLSVGARVLWTLPMFHCNGWSHTWAVIGAGATSVCVARVDPKEIWRLLEEERITHFMAAPTVLATLASHRDAHPLPSSVRVCTGGAAPTPALLRSMELLNMDVVHLYGLTETYGPVTINSSRTLMSMSSPESRWKVIARQGWPHLTASRVRVVHEDMSDVPSDGETLGEVVVAGNTTMSGYYRDRAATDAAFRGGWFHTGDIAVKHRDGQIEIRDRAKDIIISGGENISTLEVEAELGSHSAVLECAVVGIPDNIWGEVPKAYVTLREGAKVSAEDLSAFCRSRLAHFKCPKEFEFGPLPKSSTGKIQKGALRQAARTATLTLTLE